MSAAAADAVSEALRGNADELHLIAGGEHPRMTTLHGIPISDNANSLTQGTPGPVLMEDFIFREKIFHFDHERIPERVVHARGSGAHGFFELTHSLADFTTAKVLTEVGKQTPVFTRFSTVTGGIGSVDTPRDIRGFAVKFYTSEGNWDLVGNNVPVFFVQDAIKFPDLIHSVKQEPHNGIPQSSSAHDTFWDFVSLMPEAWHTVTWAMSDRAIPRSYRMIEGFGVHSFRLLNKDGKSTFVKFHWRPKLGMQSVLWDESLKLQHANNDYHRRDLWDAIEVGKFPEWEFAVQLFTEEDAAKFPFDHLDSSKIIPEELVPLKVIGRMVLNRNPENFFSETEQVAYCPANVPPGIDFSNDPLLQGRLFSYLDTQLLRLGSSNFNQLPINAPKCPFVNMMRDGKMQRRTFDRKRVAYDPSSLESDSSRACPATGFKSFAAPPADDGVRGRRRPESFADHYSQARQFYLSQEPLEQAHIALAFVFELSNVETEAVRLRSISHLRHIDESLARRVADALGLQKLPAPFPTKVVAQDLPASPSLSILKKAKNILTGRAVGMLVDTGSSADAIARFRAAVTAAGACFKLVAPRLLITLSDGNTITVDRLLTAGPSVLFDAVVVDLTRESALKLSKESAAIDFLRDAFGHLKAIAACEGTREILFPEARIKPDPAIFAINDDEGFIAGASTRLWDREPAIRILP